MYRLLGIDVVPVAVNSGLAYPPRTWVKWPGTITYKVGQTLPAGLPREEAAARVRAAINALNPPEDLLPTSHSPPPRRGPLQRGITADKNGIAPRAETRGTTLYI